MLRSLPFLLALASALRAQERLPVFEACAVGGACAEIPRAGLRAEIGADGLVLTPTAPTPWVSTPTWRIAIRTIGAGRGGDLDERVAERVTTAGSRAELARGGWLEWFETSERGVRQSWTIAHQPPRADDRPLRIGLAFEGDLVPIIADGGQSVTLKNALQEPVLHYTDLRAWDAGGRELEAHIRPSPWGIGIEVDDRDALYPVTVDPLVTPAAWFIEVEGNGGNRWHSSAIARTVTATAGDVNGDGYSDVIVGFPNFNSEAGEVRLHIGVPGGAPSVTSSWSVTGLTAGGYLGVSVSSAGDVNGDGYDDVVAGAPLEAAGDGRVYVWYGGPSGLGASGTTATADFSYTSSSFKSLGASVAPAGDVNQDGYDDIVVGAPGCPGGGCSSVGSAGAVIVFLGSASGPSASPWSTDLGLPTHAGLGWCVARAGDVNGDGFADIAVSAPWYSGSQSNEGRVFVFHGSAAFLTDFTPDWLGGAALFPSNPNYGFAIAGAGDLNGDGYADLAVGAPTYPRSGAGGTGSGRVFLFPGSSTGLSVSSNGGFEGQSAGDNYGHAVATAGDVDGDGFSDLLVGAPNEGNGAIHLIHGRPTPFGTVIGQGDQAIATTDGAEYGANLGSAGDVDGDGLTDVIVGYRRDIANNKPSRAQIFLGRLSTPGSQTQATLVGAPGYTLGNVLAPAGMVDTASQNARSDFLFGIPDANGGDGQVQLRLGLYSGLDTASAVWTSPPLGTGARAGSSVAAADVNNDGRNDVLVGCPRFTNGQFEEGRAVLFLGTSTGNLGTTPAWSFESDVTGARFGSSVAFAGDVNGDGYNDVVVGAPTDPTTGVGAGSAYLFLGGVGGLALVPARVLRGAAGWKLGTTVLTAGDVNRDGFSDLLVGSPEYANGQALEGRVDLYLGIQQGLTAAPNWTLESNQVNAQFGRALAAAGDVNNDGYADVLVGSPFYTAGQGRVLVYHGAPGGPPTITLNLATTLFGATGQPANTEFGASVAGVGDVNGDGFADIAVGSPGDDAGGGGGANRGSITLYFGSSLGIVALGSETTSGTLNGAAMGQAVAAAGDLNADGFADFGVGSPGGSGGSIDILIGGGVTASRFNTHQRRYDDLDALALLGRPETTTGFENSNSFLNSSGNPGTPMGRAFVRLQWENEPLAAIFDGSGLAQTAAWEDVALHPVGSPFQGFVAGLAIQNSYHWRSRFLIRNPYLPHTRWLTFPGNAREEKKLGTGIDCNGNGTPDALEIGQPGVNDCNNNRQPDSCDLATGFEADFDGNLVPDSCDIASNPALDCNANGVLDSRDLAVATSLDCNGNLVPDECDIASASSTDTNGDGIPDECQGSTSLYCFGDGTGTACPCGNSSAPGANEGCLSSLGIGGRLRVNGVPSVSADNLVLVGSQMPNSSALYFQGTIQQSAGAGSIFGDGKRCAAGTVIRLGTKSNSSGGSTYPSGADLAVSVKGLVPAAGGIRRYQIWYRNAAAFCTTSTFNLTNGLDVTWSM